MDGLMAIALGLEVQRFASSNDSADVLAGSLDALQSGAWTLSPYQGPAIQPYVLLQLQRLSVGLAPSGSWRQLPATAADGREGTLRVAQWQLEGRAYWTLGRARLGVDAAFSSGQATINGEAVADATAVIRVAPTAGVVLDLSDELALVGRVLWPVEILDTGSVHGPSAALAIEWRP